MVSERTYRRKLQKKAKRKRFRKCPRCGDRLVCRVGYMSYDVHYESLICRCDKCGYTKSWSIEKRTEFGVAGWIVHMTNWWA